MFHPDQLIDRLRSDDAVRRRAIDRAAPWSAYSDDDLWRAIFGPSITRSWMVLSDGYCPGCQANVNMYDWQMDPFAHPFKTQCPSCNDLFPRNDFEAFYRSGLGEGGLFAAERADRALLVDERGSEQSMGIDDGEGYRADDRVWRFIGAYLIYGHWKKLIVDGVDRLAAAWIATGDPAYARRSGILLDRISDVYPDFDFGPQAVLYERPADRGYVSTWHDACHEIQRLTLAYDQIRPALLADADLVEFLKAKTDQCELPTSKDSPEQICDNIEQRILQDTLDNNEKIESNFPTTEVARILIHATLADGGTSAIPGQIDELFDDILTRGTAVDGVSGEKGLSGYAAIAPRSIASSLSLFSRADAEFLPRVLARHPQLHEHFRFHIDTWVGRRYYPNVGDAGAPSAPSETLVGPVFDRDRQDPLAPSMYSFYWQLYLATRDRAFVDMLVQANDGDTHGLPHDPACTDAEQFRTRVDDVLSATAQASTQQPRLVQSVNKTQYHLAILRSEDERRGPVTWLDYDSGALNSVYAYRLDPSVRGRGAHSHADGMNLGLYYRGLDMMHDFGYPPVNYGGWDCPRAEWAKRTISHNTFVIDGLDQANGEGETCWWVDGPHATGLCVSAPGLIDRDHPEGLRFERSVLLLPLDDDEGYLVDMIHLVGGQVHQRFVHAGFGSLSTQGLDLRDGSPDDAAISSQCRRTQATSLKGALSSEDLLRAWRVDADPARGWTADWSMRDHYGMAIESDIHLRYSDLSDDALVATCESWSLFGYYGDRNEEWIERVLQQRRGPAPLQSSFVGTLEPYVRTPQTTARRLDSGDQIGAAVETAITDGRRDVVVIGDPLPESKQDDSSLVVTGDLQLHGPMGVVRFDAASDPASAILVGKRLQVGELIIESDGDGPVELWWSQTGVHGHFHSSKEAVNVIYRGQLCPIQWEQH